MSQVSQSFNDGVVNIYKVGDIALPGDMPKEGLVLQQTLRYKERTVGLNRFYAALQNSIKVDLVIRCQQIRSVSTQDVAILQNGQQYEIKQIQYPEDADPHVMDLTLERLGVDYGTS